MFCHQCGAKLQDGALFCSACGTRVSTERPNKPMPVVKKESVSSSTIGNTKATKQKTTNNKNGQRIPSVDDDTLCAVRRAIKQEMKAQETTSMRVVKLGLLVQSMNPPFDCTKYGFNNLTHFFKSYPELFSVSGHNVSLVKLPSEDRTITPPDDETISMVCRAMYDQTLQSGETCFSTSDLGTLFSDIPTPFKASNYGYRSLTEFFTSFPDLFFVAEEGISLTQIAVDRASKLSPVKPAHAIKKQKYTDTTIIQSNNTNEPETIGAKSVVGGTFFSYKAGDYAYMRIMTSLNNAKNDTSVLLKGIDGVTESWMPYPMFNNFAKNAEKGDYIWVYLSELVKKKDNLNQYKIYIVRDNERKHNLAQQSKTFVASHSVGDRLLVPIKEVTEKFVSVCLTPDYLATIYKNITEIKQYIAENGILIPVEIAKIVPVPEKTYSRVQLNFLGSDMHVALPDVVTDTTQDGKQVRGDVLDSLPASMNEVSIPPRVLSQYIDEGIAEQICRITGESRLTETAFRRFLDERYQDAKSKRRLRYGKRKTDKNDVDSASVYSFEMDLDDIRTVPDLTKICSNGGSPVTACFKKGGDKKTWVLNLFGTVNAGHYFEHHVHISSWNDILDELSELALDECWDLPTSSTPKIILKRYLQYTYYKCWIDGNLMDSMILNANETKSPFRMFNTGLVDNKYDDIFCVLERIDPSTDGRGREWSFKCFGVRNGGEASKKIINSYFDFTKYEKESKPIKYIKPLRYKYKTIVNNEEKEIELIIDDYRPLIFNPDLEINIHNDHICLDNVSRLPIEFLEITSVLDPTVHEKFLNYKAAKTRAEDMKTPKAESEARDAFKAYKKALSSNDLVYRHMFTLLQNAIKEAKKQCRWNYKTAIPIYYPRNNGLSLLLPIKLQQQRDNSADVALVVQQLTSNSYQGETILTMEMAFQNARQICRPNSEWLTVENVGKAVASESDGDEDADEE